MAELDKAKSGLDQLGSCTWYSITLNEHLRGLSEEQKEVACSEGKELAVPHWQRAAHLLCLA